MSASRDISRVIDLAYSIHEGRSTPEEVAQFEMLCMDSPQACDAYRAFSQLRSILHLRARGEHALKLGQDDLQQMLELPLPDRCVEAEGEAVARKAELPPPVPGNRFHVRPQFVAIAATLLLVGYFVGMAILVSRRDAERSKFALAPKAAVESSAMAGDGEPVATLAQAENAQWAKDSQPVLGGVIESDKPYRLKSGFVALQLKQGASIVVEGPAEWSIVDANRAILQSGRVVATVSPQAVGFTVVTPSARVVDLGTEFAVEVTDDGATEVHVSRGTVDVYRAAAGMDLSGNSSQSAIGSQATRLHAGQAARANPGAPSTSEIEFQVIRFARAEEVRRSRVRTLPTKMVDLAKSSTAQSSTWADDSGNFSAQAAVDGDIATASHTTGDEPGQWWQVDLGQTSDIAAVELKNREICCGWLRDVRLKVLGEDGKTELYVSDVLNPGNESFGGPQEFERGPAQLMVDLRRTHGKAVRGRFVRVERTACEVKAEQLPLEQRASVIAAAGKAIVLAEVQVFVERESTPSQTRRLDAD